jgi:hypothetical protein
VLLKIQSRESRTINRYVPQLLVSSRIKVVYKESLCETQEFTRTLLANIQKKGAPSLPLPNIFLFKTELCHSTRKHHHKSLQTIPKLNPESTRSSKFEDISSLSCQARTIIPPAPPVPLSPRARVLVARAPVARVPVAHPKASLRTR